MSTSHVPSSKSFVTLPAKIFVPRNTTTYSPTRMMGSILGESRKNLVFIFYFLVKTQSSGAKRAMARLKVGMSIFIWLQ